MGVVTINLCVKACNFFSHLFRRESKNALQLILALVCILTVIVVWVTEAWELLLSDSETDSGGVEPPMSAALKLYEKMCVCVCGGKLKKGECKAWFKYNIGAYVAS